MNQPIAVSIPEAVRASGMSRTALYEALKRGSLTAVKSGKRTLIPYSNLTAFVASLPVYRTGA